MSMTRDVTLGYVNFFTRAADFAVLPYTGTFLLAGKKDDGSFDWVSASLALSVLTFVVPVLPSLFSLTSSLAMLAASLAVASMFILYPIALISDLCNNDRSYGYAY